MAYANITHQCELESKFFDCKKLLAFLKEKNILPDYWKNFESWTEDDYKDFNTEYMDIELELGVEVERGEAKSHWSPGYSSSFDCNIEAVKLLKFTEIREHYCPHCQSQSLFFDTKSQLNDETQNYDILQQLYKCHDCNAVLFDFKDCSKEQRQAFWDSIAKITPSNVTLDTPIDITEFIQNEDDDFFTDISEKYWSE
jgi:hypothetical protein